MLQRIEREKIRKEEIGKRRVRDGQGAWWIHNFEVNNEIICDVKL